MTSFFSNLGTWWAYEEPSPDKHTREQFNSLLRRLPVRTKYNEAVVMSQHTPIPPWAQFAYELKRTKTLLSPTGHLGADLVSDVLPWWVIMEQKLQSEILNFDKTSLHAVRVPEPDLTWAYEEHALIRRTPNPQFEFHGELPAPPSPKLTWAQRFLSRVKRSRQKTKASVPHVRRSILRRRRR